ncbi:hypothetical protein JOC75_003576 [Metabacillus crassostreae]|uniref:hypothetical protein n=1 Tax=Metabacillus crassostreae TaxID=929098 RepID=UPI001957EB87|nr:hypothetical protein [Metabacillus crassostreae]MBM7605553.1 hypothetical protein [Metabacillus crassostreae]
MDHINSLQLSDFVSIPVKVTIQGSDKEEQPSWMNKTIQSSKLCPDGTHIRLYFDQRSFIAFPKTCKVTRKGDIWSAYDDETCLTYLIKRAC